MPLGLKFPEGRCMMSTDFWLCTGHQRRCETKNKPSSTPSHQILKDQLIQINTELWTVSGDHQFSRTQQDGVGLPMAPCLLLKVWLGYREWSLEGAPSQICHLVGCHREQDTLCLSAQTLESQSSIHIFHCYQLLKSPSTLVIIRRLPL